MWNHRRLQVANATLRKKYKAGGITLPDLKLYYKTTISKTVWHWQKETHRSIG